ncbi:hypothetical protein ACLOJK_023725 [Asimina triloba]
MGRKPCCDKVGLKKGPWTAEEDKKLINFLVTNGQCCWRAVPKLAGLLRCGKSCRLRWTNYLRPDLKRGLLSDSEEKLVIDLHSRLGNRTDNEIKNHWNTHIKKKLKKMGIDPVTHMPLSPPASTTEDKPKPANDSANTDANIKKSINASSSLSPNSSVVTEEHQKSISSADDDLLLRKSPGFCTDEVPMIEPHEILVPSASSTADSSTTTTTTTVSLSADSSVISPDVFDLPSLEWPESMYLWGVDDLNGWNFAAVSDHHEVGNNPWSEFLEPWKFEL